MGKSNKRTKKIDSRLDLFLCEILFGFWQLDIKVMELISHMVINVSLILTKIILPKAMRRKFINSQNKGLIELSEYWYNPTDGFCISNAIRLLDGCLFGYLSPVAFIIGALTVLIFHYLKAGYIMTLVSILGIWIFETYFFGNKVENRYRKYFDGRIDKSEKSINQCIKHSIYFAIGAFIALILGICLTVLFFTIHFKLFGCVKDV